MARFDRLPRFLFLLISLIFLILGMLAGLMRLGWLWAWIPPALAVSHGPLMICGFLGTLISLERAVALSRWWAYAAPLLTALGTLGIVAGLPDKLGMLLIALGSLALVFVFVRVLLWQPTFHTVTMGLGAGTWLIGNMFWLLGISIPQMAHWWIGFLVLTIAGERLELNRLLAPSRFARLAFGVGLVVLTVGLVSASFLPTQGRRIAGLGMLVLALWLSCFDVARLTVRREGLPRFIALSLLAGYVWLGIGGLIWAWASPVDAIGSYSFFAYDAMLHSVFLGFVFSMIFAHAPIIFPAVVGRPLAYRRAFYAHVLALHLSLIVRVSGDLFASFSVLKWAGVANVIAVLLFLANSGYSMVAGQSKARTAM
jgi:hypothetical protein